VSAVIAILRDVRDKGMAVEKPPPSHVSPSVMVFALWESCSESKKKKSTHVL
jgi:hypothetical protein